MFGGPPAKLQLKFADEEALPKAMSTAGDGKSEVEMPVFAPNDDVKGSVLVAAKPGKAVEHMGLKVELIGQVRGARGGPRGRCELRSGGWWTGRFSGASV